MDSAAYKHTDEEKINIANRLAEFLLSKNDINCIWSVNKPFSGKQSILDYLYHLAPNTLKDLMEKGLNLNPITHNGVAHLIFMIGNAENSGVAFLLDMVARYQPLESRKIWINKTDAMTRCTFPERCCCFFLSKPLITAVQQTALQLAIAQRLYRQRWFR